MTESKKDDLEAVRSILDTMKGFGPEEQERIFRWVAEKLGIPQHVTSTAQILRLPQPHVGAAASPPGGASDIRTFVAEKKPRSDIQFAAVVAYYYRFEAPPAERKEAINKEDLQEATRKAGRERFANPRMTLFNAHTLGLLDKGAEKATFTINSVGENLVAMTLPDGSSAAKPPKKRKPARSAAKKAPLKKAKKV